MSKRPNPDQLRKMQLQRVRLGIEPVTLDIYIYTELAPKLPATASVAQSSVERSLKVQGRRFNSQLEALEWHFSQLVPVGS